jgi:RNA polymerase-interacting CarD/CdnL/TRCF family regulator
MSEAKLSSTLGLAEILRDGTRREGAHVSRSQPSPAERELLNRARELLTTEIALSRGVERAEASSWIDAQLSSAAL